VDLYPPFLYNSYNENKHEILKMLPTVSYELQTKVFDKIETLRKQALELFNLEVPFIPVEFNVRGAVAGKMDIHCGIMYLNPILLIENEQNFIDRTVTHEFAHYVDKQLYPENFDFRKIKRSLHGPTWKRIMRKFGADDSRCHTYDVSSIRRKKTKKYVWVAKDDPSVKMELGSKRHRKMILGQARYYPRGHKTTEFVYKDVRYPNKTNTNMSRSNKTSKLEQCRSIVKNHPTLTRKELIEKFIDVAGCTKAGASTYYYKLK
jgi:predicted SprT family Zn-dependent metalloprotease